MVKRLSTFQILVFILVGGIFLLFIINNIFFSHEDQQRNENTIIESNNSLVADISLQQRDRLVPLQVEPIEAFQSLPATDNQYPINTDYFTITRREDGVLVVTMKETSRLAEAALDTILKQLGYHTQLEKVVYE